MSPARWMLGTAIDVLTDREHGSKHNQVPGQWRHGRQLWSVYAWSSWAYAVTGVTYLFLLHRYPSKALHAGESIDALLWMWQGVVSFWCDFIDLGVPSWSHPIDRISANAFILSQLIKFFIFVREVPWSCNLLFPPALTASLWTFRMSVLAVARKDAPAFFFWHTVWHFALPLAGVMFYVLRFIEAS